MASWEPDACNLMAPPYITLYPHMLRQTGMCRPSGLLFHQKSLDMGPILFKKILKEGPISQNLRIKCKITIFLGRKTPRKRSRFAKISKKNPNKQTNKNKNKKQKTCLFSRFLSEKYP